MSQNENSETKNPEIQAGAEIIDQCPKCSVKFQSPVALNVKHTCPNPQCNCKFQYMVFD